MIVKITLIYGGKSAEHEISLLSAFSILQAMYYEYYQVQLVYIDPEGNWLKGPELTAKPEEKEHLRLSLQNKAAYYSSEKIEPCQIKEAETVVFPILHGPNGEDGTIQGFLEMIDMPYVGAGVLASACAMDKIMTKNLLMQAGIPQVPFVPVLQSEWLNNEAEIFQRCEGTLVYPMYVKPANLGSSVGISKVDTKTALKAAIENALNYDRRVIVEQGVEAREIEIGIIGNEDVRSSLAGEIVKDVSFYDFHSKYIDNQVKLQIPADIPDEVHKKAREYAQRAYKLLDISGLSRCDFFLGANLELFLNEINTMPGFTPYSMYPLLWENMGISYGDLIEELILLARIRHEQKTKLQSK